MAGVRARHDAVCDRRLVLPIALLVLLSAFTPTWLGGQAREWVGCYDLEIGPWSRPILEDSLSYAPPPRIRLDTLQTKDVRSSDATSHPVRPAPGSPPSRHEYAVWSPESTDSLVIRWSTGFSGLRVRLTREGTLLRGRASTFVDSTPFEPYIASVIARPVDCGAPMPPEHRSWRRFPREVPLEMGVTLTLGEPLPREDLALEHYRSNSDWIRHRPTGLFSGATDVSVARDERGIVMGIHVHFDPKMSLDALESRLASSLGPPTHRRINRSQAQIYWLGRERYSFRLSRFTTNEGEERLMISISGG